MSQLYNLSQRKRTNDVKSSAMEFKRFKGTALERDPSHKFKLKVLSGERPLFTRTNDEVHESIDICPVMKAFIDTKYFQRLRDIKQLGTSYLVYMTCDHNRFQHSLGVAHLARKICKIIHENQKNLKTTPKDILCVTLAGLLHDIGHGPYSHIYEMFTEGLKKKIKKDPFLEARYAQYPPEPEDWDHERTSLMMIDALLEHLGLAIDEENLDDPLKQIGDGIDARSMCAFYSDSPEDHVLTSRDFIFIKECIYGKHLPGSQKLIGRTEPHKEWLYDIVKNRFSGLDVDKIDYLARDAMRAKVKGGIEIPIVYDPLVARARCSGGKKCDKCNNPDSEFMHYMICYPMTKQTKVLEFFRTRFHLHDVIYQHKVTSASGAQVCDILEAADLHLLQGSKNLPISRASIDRDAFTGLDDSIIKDVLKSKSPELAEARQLAERYQARDIYKCAAQLMVDMDDSRNKRIWELEVDDMVEEIMAVARQCLDEGIVTETLDEKDFLFLKCKLHHGSKDDNPVLEARFVTEKDMKRINGPLDDLPVAIPPDEKALVHRAPGKFMERVLRLVCRNHEKRDLLEQVFDVWISSTSGAGTATAATTPARVSSSEMDESASPDIRHSNSSSNSDEGSAYGSPRPLPPFCTQDSGDEMTPKKDHVDRENDIGGSPIPVPKFGPI